MIKLLMVLISGFAAVFLSAIILRGMGKIEKTRFHKGVVWSLVGIILVSVVSSAIALTAYCKGMADTQTEAESLSETESSNGNVSKGVNIPRMTVDRDMSVFQDKRTDEKKWKQMTEEEKLALLSAVADTENEYLHLSEDFKIVSETLGEKTLGIYVFEENKIAVSKNCLENYSLEDNINTVCHEAYHAFQNELVHAYRMGYIEDSVVESYHYEFDDYVNGDEDYDVYRDQQCEEDAREYAKKATRLYIQELM